VRLGVIFAQGRNVAIMGNFKRTSGTREDGGLPSKMRGSMPWIAPDRKLSKAFGRSVQAIEQRRYLLSRD
jgi:hypothetical protein